MNFVDMALALDPVRFSESVGVKPDPWQARMLRSQSRQLLLNCSRQVGKSTTAGTLALHRVLYQPDALVIMVSKAQRQSSELFRKVMEMMERLKVRPALVEENKLSLQTREGGRIVSLPGNAATVRGFSGVDLLIEDEAAFVHDELYTAVRPMLAVKRGQLVLMSTPFGKRGHFYKAWSEGGPSWERISIPATECPRISKEFLESERAALGDWRFRQEYMCEFVDSDDTFFSYDHVMAALSREAAPLFDASGAPGPVDDGDKVEPLVFSEDP